MKKLWVHIKPFNVLVGTAPKVARSSLNGMLVAKWPPSLRTGSLTKTGPEVERFTRVELERALEIGDIPKYWIIREPWSRFKSFYTQKIIPPGGLIDKGRVYDRILKDHSPKWIFEYFRDHLDHNAHWEPQYRLMGEFRDVTMIPFGRFNDFMVKIGFTEEELLHLNLTAHPEFNDWPNDGILEVRVRELYREDYELWRNAVEGYNDISW